MGVTYTFHIFDSYGDGICCAYGEGRYYLQLNGVEMVRGGEFGGLETYAFTPTATHGGVDSYSYSYSYSSGLTCAVGYVADCSGDGDCCPESWIGDDLCDGEDQEWGCDLSCFDNDGGDCDGDDNWDDESPDYLLLLLVL